MKDKNKKKDMNLAEEFKFLKKQNEELRRNLIFYQAQDTKFGDINSKDFWEEHYKKGGNSGIGSYNKLAEFKAEIINELMKQKQISNVLEIGCGDGNQLRLLDCKDYTGVDVSETIIKYNKERYSGDKNKKFYLTSENIYRKKKYNLTISLDVIFHLLEEDVFENYMKDLFELSEKYVIIYSSNHEEITIWPEYRHRRFIKYIQDNLKKWQLIKYIPNPYPYMIGKETETSAADFYIFEKK